MYKGARALEEHDLEGAMKMLYDALDIYETEGKEHNAGDIYRLGIAAMIK